MRTHFVEELKTLFWNIWFRQAWDMFLPRNSWKEKGSNLEVGDIGLKGPGTKIGSSHFVLCHVLAVEKDDQGLVRSVEVESRPRNSREKGLPFIPRQLVRERLPSRG